MGSVLTAGVSAGNELQYTRGGQNGESGTKGTVQHTMHLSRQTVYKYGKILLGFETPKKVKNNYLEERT